MKTAKFLISLIISSVYAYTLWYILTIQYFFSLVSYGAYEVILSDNKQSIFLLCVGVFHAVAILLFAVSIGKSKKLLTLSGVLGGVYVLILAAYRLIESFIIGVLIFDPRSVLGHLICFIFAILTLLVTHIQFGEQKLEMVHS